MNHLVYRTLSLTAVIFAVLGAAPLRAELTPAEIDRWVAELGDDNYQVRKAAAERLAKGGFAARAALDRVANGPDPEIRAAARRLITLIDDGEFNRRLVEFAADTDGSRGRTLPGWTEFSAMVGSDPAARALFVEMQRDEGPLLERTFPSEGAAGDIPWESHLAALQRSRSFGPGGDLKAPLGSTATLLFLGARPNTNLSDGAASSLMQLMQIPPINQQLAPDGRGDNAVRRLVTACVVRCPNRNEGVLQQRLSIIFQHQLAGALPLALEMIRRDPKFLTQRPQQQVLAILAVGKFGSAEHIADLEPLLDDRGEVMPAQPMPGAPGELRSVQVRDVALAALLYLTGQDPVTYGFIHARSNPQMLFEISSLSLASDDERAAAVEKWRTWRAQNPTPAPRSAS